MGRLSIAPGIDLRCLLMGYFEGIDSERGIAYLVSVSLSLREFLGLSLEAQTSDHSTLAKTRGLMNLGTHKAVFRRVLKRLAAFDIRRFSSGDSHVDAPDVQSYNYDARYGGDYVPPFLIPLHLEMQCSIRTGIAAGCL